MRRESIEWPSPFDGEFGFSVEAEGKPVLFCAESDAESAPSEDRKLCVLGSNFHWSRVLNGENAS